MHSALEAYWRKNHNDLRLSDALCALRVYAGVDPYDLAVADALLIGYDTRWEAEHYEVLAVEREFSAPLVNPATGHLSKTFVVGGKLDALVRAQDGQIYLVEHKTSSEDLGAGSPYWRRLRIDSQVSTYYAGARALGFDVAGCIYDVVGKPKLRPSKATPLDDRKYTKKTRELYASQRESDETPDEFHARVLGHIAEQPDRYYQRGMVVRLEAEEREAAFDTWQTTRLIREAEIERRHPRNADACARWGRMCSYFDVCTGTASIDDPTRYRQSERTHEELGHVDDKQSAF